jgi:LETM1 and EF-hand domain-containing protein 1
MHDWDSRSLRQRYQFQPWSTFSTDAAVQKEETQTQTFKGTTTTNIPKPSRKLGPTPVPTPPSAPPEESPLQSLQKASTKSIIRKAMDMTVSASRTIVTFLVKLPGNIIFYATHPKESREAWHKLRDAAKEEAHHYWVGTKLLWADIRTARKLLGKTLEGNALTRRERKQLLRTVSDLFRLIPFSMFVLIPFMEFALPLALKIFPNMLPSTYQDSLKAEENMKRELKSRIAMAEFFQE